MTGVCLGWLIKMQTAEMIQTEKKAKWKEVSILLLSFLIFLFFAPFEGFFLEQWRHTKYKTTFWLYFVCSLSLGSFQKCYQNVI